MKMEVNVLATSAQDGLTVESIVVVPGDVVRPGDTMIVTARAQNGARTGANSCRCQIPSILLLSPYKPVC